LNQPFHLIFTARQHSLLCVERCISYDQRIRARGCLTFFFRVGVLYKLTFDLLTYLLW